MSSIALIFGAPGSGKSTVLERLTERLDAAGLGYCALESEQFDRGEPRLGFERMLEQLVAVVAMQRAWGRSLFLVAMTLEGEDELAVARAALCDGAFLAVGLDAPAELCASRVAAREREAWVGKRALVGAARRLAMVNEALPADLRIDTAHVDADVAARRIMQALLAGEMVVS